MNYNASVSHRDPMDYVSSVFELCVNMNQCLKSFMSIILRRSIIVRETKRAQDFSLYLPDTYHRFERFRSSLDGDDVRCFITRRRRTLSGNDGHALQSAEEVVALRYLPTSSTTLARHHCIPTCHGPFQGRQSRFLQWITDNLSVEVGQRMAG